ncbi:alpha/beta hydrolase [Kitasatospora sp. NPDC048540]|uniref:alpha/beta fold hydrolase n=1 Tax=unclassified Kitasatospora TaxID=2633591 RepID=UPI000539729F|nr:alpha/beta hydrolase [Kitasatospora sp. MBT63]
MAEPTGHGWSWLSWDRISSGPDDAEQRALLLPGGLCTADEYRELMAEPALAGVRLTAVTLPGHGGTPPPRDCGLENYARLAAECAAGLGADVVVGHSMGANVAIEMAASGRFRGPVILLAPSFSRQDESRFLRTLDRLALVLGHLPYSAMLKIVDGAAKDSPLPPDRKAELVADLRRNDPRVMRRVLRGYLGYLDRYGSVAPRLRGADGPAWVVHGESGDGGITADERRLLLSRPGIRVITLPGESFFTPAEEPALVASYLTEALAAALTAARGPAPDA